jgi:hydrogenase maturation protein HypF
MDLTGSTPEIIAGDLHPGYSNRRIGKKLMEEYDIPYVDVQHHWAHAASLLVDNNKMEGTVLSLDGTGYGSDGNAWGGEVISTDLSSYSRDAHLEYIPLLGSDRALYDLRRLKFAVDVINGRENELFSDQESAVMKKLMRTSVRTSSMGRLLDALAFTLGHLLGENIRRRARHETGTSAGPWEAHTRIRDRDCQRSVKTSHLFDRIGRRDRLRTRLFDSI